MYFFFLYSIYKVRNQNWNDVQLMGSTESVQKIVGQPLFHRAMQGKERNDERWGGSDKHKTLNY